MILLERLEARDERASKGEGLALDPASRTEMERLRKAREKWRQEDPDFEVRMKPLIEIGKLLESGVEEKDLTELEPASQRGARGTGAGAKAAAREAHRRSRGPGPPGVERPPGQEAGGEEQPRRLLPGPGGAGLRQAPGRGCGRPRGRRQWRERPSGCRGRVRGQALRAVAPLGAGSGGQGSCRSPGRAVPRSPPGEEGARGHRGPGLHHP